MSSYRKKSIGIAVLSVFLIIIAALCRYLSGRDLLEDALCAFLRRSIHTALLLGWMFSLNKRIMNRQAKTYLLWIAGLILFWFTVRSIKYDLPFEMHTLTRWLWYCFYIPMLFIPLFGLFSTRYLGRLWSYVSPKSFKILYLPNFLLLTLVMTNDLHQFVFVNPNDRYGYTHGPGYFFVVAWIAVLVGASFVYLFRRSRLPGKGKRLFLPLLVVAAAGLYSVLYICCYDLMKPFLGDMTTVFGILIVAIVEACIYTGLIPTNTQYIELLRASTDAILITDEKYRIFQASDHVTAVPQEILSEVTKAPIMLKGHLRLSQANIKGGHVFWTTDVKELLEVITKLEEINEELLDRQLVLQEEYQTRRKKQSLVEKNRLYNKMQDQTKEQLDALVRLTDAIEKSNDIVEIEHLIGKAAVITAYLKRRNNLIFEAEELDDVPATELEYCLRESMVSLGLFGKSCELKTTLSGSLSFAQMTAAYDAFEKAVAYFMEQFEALFVAVHNQNSLLTMRMEIVTALDLTELAHSGFQVTQEELKEWHLEATYERSVECV